MPSRRRRRGIASPERAILREWQSRWQGQSNQGPGCLSAFPTPIVASVFTSWSKPGVTAIKPRFTSASTATRSRTRTPPSGPQNGPSNKPIPRYDVHFEGLEGLAKGPQYYSRRPVAGLFLTAGATLPFQFWGCYNLPCNPKLTRLLESNHGRFRWSIKCAGT